MKTERFSKGTHKTEDRRPLGDRFTTWPPDVQERKGYRDIKLGEGPSKEDFQGAFAEYTKYRDDYDMNDPQEGPTKVNLAWKTRKPPFPQGDKEYLPNPDDVSKYEEMDEELGHKGYRRMR